jgi:hypothetical protein
LIPILIGGLEHGFDFSIQLGMSSSQLANSIIFQRGRLNHQPEAFEFRSIIFWGENSLRKVSPKVSPKLQAWFMIFLGVLYSPIFIGDSLLSMLHFSLRIP